MQGQTEEVLTPRQCFIKTQFLNLQERVELEFRNNFCKISAVQKSILNQAKVLSDDILKAHDQKADCECFVTVTARVSLTSNQENMREHLKSLESLLEKLDAERNGQKRSNSKMNVSTSALNPLSSCFVPKFFSQMYESSIVLNVKSAAPSRETPVVKLADNPSGPWNKERPVTDAWKVNGPRKTKNAIGYIKSKQAADSRLLLNCFYGMYRQRATDCPTLRMPQRPAKFTSPWSVTPEDRKLWNSGTLTSPCGCPPSFGYSLPSGFFGDVVNTNGCTECRPHVSFYPDSATDDELDLVTNHHEMTSPLYHFPLYQLFDEDETTESDKSESDECTEEEREKRLEGYKDMFTRFVSEICSLAKQLENMPSENVSKNGSDEGIFVDEGSCVPRVKCGKDVLSKNNLKNLLRADMMKGLIYDSSAWNLSASDAFNQTTVSLNKTGKMDCDPPCSIWCDSTAAKKPAPQVLSNLQKSRLPSGVGKNYPLKISADRSSSMLNGSFHLFKGNSSGAKLGSLEPLRKAPKPTVGPDRTRNGVAAEANNRFRHASGDSGYYSEHGASSKPREMYLHSCGSDFSHSPYDNDLWTPLPDCLHNTASKETEQKSTGWHPVFDRRCMKPKSKPKKVNKTEVPKELHGNLADFPALSAPTKVEA